MTHLITLQNKEDASKVAHAVADRFPAYSVNTAEIRMIDLPVTEFRITAEYSGKKRLTNAEVNIMLNLIPAYAQAFYKGMVEGKRAVLEKAAKLIDEELTTAW